MLGASYTLPCGKWVVNEVPIVMFLMTHPYFCSYHVLAAMIIRRTGVHASCLRYVIAVLLMAYVTAFLETWSIAAYPHYVCPSLTSPVDPQVVSHRAFPTGW